MFLRSSLLFPKTFPNFFQRFFPNVSKLLEKLSLEKSLETNGSDPGHSCDFDFVANLQPDLALVSRSLKRIGQLDLCRPFDSHSKLLSAAHQRKLGTYGPLLETLQSYIERGWKVHILLWIVGVSGMIDAKSVSEMLDFLQVAQNRRAKIAKDLAIESVKALHSLHQIRY